MSGRTVLVTGATGLVGRCVAKRLCDAGYRVQAMVRSQSSRTALDGVGVEFVEGDLGDVNTLPPALADAEYVVHAAAHIGDWGPAEKYRAMNVVALEHMLNAAMRTGKLDRWIQISSLGVYPARHHHGTDETTPASLAGLDGYTRTKAEAEVLIRQHITDHGLRAVILRPGFIYGPGERHSLPRVMEKIEAGTMKYIGPGDKLLNNTYVGNLADAVLLAMKEEAAVGETFNIRDERLVTREEYIKTVADYLGKPNPKHVPEGLARILVRPIERIAKLRGAEEAPLLTGARIKFMTLNLDFSIAKAKRILGYKPSVDFRQGMLEALDDLTGKQA